MKETTIQGMFDYAVRFLHRQGEPSLAEDQSAAYKGPDCAYRGVGGMMCAVGCLITDEEYLPEMEGVSASEMVEDFLGIEDVPTQNFLDDLQFHHDNKWKKGNPLPHGLAKLASRFNLNTDVLDEVGYGENYG